MQGRIQRGAIGGIKPPDLPNTHGYPPKPPFIFEMKQWRERGVEEEKERKKKRVDMSPLYIFELDSPLCGSAAGRLGSAIG